MSTAVVSPSGDGATSKFAAWQAWIVVFSASLFFLFEFMQVNMFNAIAPGIIRSFHIDAVQLGNLSTAYFYANVLFLFPAGMLLDRFSPRKVILVAMAACVTCTFLLSMSQTLFQAELCRMVTGIGGAFCLLGCVRIASRWFPPRRMALIVGLIVTMAMIGAMLAQTPFTIAVDAIGWRRTIAVDSSVGALMLIILWMFIKDYPPGTEGFFADEHNHLAEAGFFHSLSQTVRNPQNWFCGIYASMINLPLMILGATWGSMYLVQIHHFDRDNASLITSMIFFGMILGSPAMGWVSDRIRRRKLPMIIGAVFSIVTILAIMYLPNLSFVDLMVLFFALGFIVASQVLAYPLVAESNPAMLTGASEGVASTLIMSGGFTTVLFPVLLDVHWKHIISHQIPIYSARDYHYALAIIPVAFVIALLASFLLKETHCLSYEERHDLPTEPIIFDENDAVNTLVEPGLATNTMETTS